MIRTAYLTLACVCVLGLSSNAFGVAITCVTSTTANGGFILNSSSIITGDEGNNDFTGPFGTNPNRVNLDFTILDKGIQDQVVFDVDATNLAETEYEFAVTFNFVGQGAVNGFDVELINTGAATVFERFPEPNLPAFTSTATGVAAPFAFLTPNLNPINSTGPIRFGGLNGGGGHLLPNGDTVTSFFTVDVASGGALNQSFALAFTANPEPSAFALAFCALVPLGLHQRRRKRKQQAEASVAV